jgi:hypothetical protein
VRRDCDTYADGNGYAYTNGYGDGHCYSYSNAQTDAYAESCANTETSSHPAAKTIGYRSLGSSSIVFSRPAFCRTDPRRGRSRRWNKIT